MVDQELLQAIRAAVQEELKPINERLGHMEQDISGIKERLDTIEESLGEVRGGVNELLDWAEKVGDSIDFPLPKIG